MSDSLSPGDRASGARQKVERSRVHAVAQACGFRSVVEHMPQMSIATRAGNGIANHAEGQIPVLDDVLFRDRLPETRPARARLELGARVVEHGVAADAVIQTISVVVRVLAGPGALGARSACDVVRLG